MCSEEAAAVVVVSPAAAVVVVAVSRAHFSPSAAAQQLNAFFTTFLPRLVAGAVAVQPSCTIPFT